jgi:hypothetical protein
LTLRDIKRGSGHPEAKRSRAVQSRGQDYTGVAG